MSRAAVFVDRDGVVNALIADPLSGSPESPLAPGDVVLLDGVPQALRRIADAGFLLVGVSNQPAAAKGLATREALDAVQARVIELLAEAGARFDDFRICPHHPQGSDPELAIECDCRKPAPGMLLDAARTNAIDLAASWMVGDTDADVAAGTAAGTRTVLVTHGASAHKRAGGAIPTHVASGLPEAVQIILGGGDS